MKPGKKPYIAYTETNEQRRLNETREGHPVEKGGPYLSERQWETVREDYSHDGNAWDYFSHDQSRSRAYRTGIIARSLDRFARMNPSDALNLGKADLVARMTREQVAG